MRVPEESARPVRRGSHRRSIWVLVALIVVVALLLIVEAGSGLYANFLWFHFAGFGEVWSAATATKVVLGLVFVAAAFGLCFGSLLLVDVIAPRAMFMAPEAELVRRYQAVIGGRARWVRVGVSLIIGLLLGVGASSQWQHWMLFEHAVSFGKVDPTFNLDDSFFVFRLPFLSFLVGWILVALIVVFLLSAVAHFFNGAIRFQGAPRIEPRAIAHLSLLLGVMALVRAWGYYFVDRFRLDLASDGVVQGASYTDLHVRLPAMTLLAVVSLVAFAMLVFNAYQRSLVLPAVAVVLWALLAFALGIVYPAVLQAFRVTPNASTLEAPSIRNNLAATQYAMGIGSVASTKFPVNEDLTPDLLSQYSSTLADVELWDPTKVKATFDADQDETSYLDLTNLSLDRYRIGGRLTPVDIAVRALDSSRLPSTSWVSEHLEYTHGYGAVLAPANTATPTGEPVYDLARIPQHSASGVPTLRQPAVYFAPGMSQYVVVDSTQAEVDYPNAKTATAETSHYVGSGGVPLDSFFTRLAYAFDLKDFNLLISGKVTARSRLISVPDIRSRVQRALPFATVDNTPYPVIDHGRLEWVVGAFTTSASFPDGEDAITSELAGGNALDTSFNYVRDSIVAVVDAYSGKMRFYALDPDDPILRSWERTFPGLIEPASKLDPTLAAHLQYPTDLFEVQAAMYAGYHVTQASAFQIGANTWRISEASGTSAGTPKATLANEYTTYTPIYELLQLPGDRSPSFEAIEPLVPYSSTGNLETLSALLFADSAPGADYGRLEGLVIPHGGVPGPELANEHMLRDPGVVKQLAQLEENGSSVTLGAIQVLPIADSLLYVRPVYVSASGSDLPELADVIVMYGKRISIEPTAAQAFADVFGNGKTNPAPALPSAVSAEIRSFLAQASADYKAATAALAHGDLGTYQRDVTAANAEVTKAQALLNGAAPTKAPSATSTSHSTASTTTLPSGTGSTAPNTSSNAARTTSTSAIATSSGARTAGQVVRRTAGVVEAPQAPDSGQPTVSPAPASTSHATSTGSRNAEVRGSQRA